MTKALCGSGLPWVGRDRDSGREDDRGCSESGEVKRCGGDALANCDDTWDEMLGSDDRKSFPLAAGFSESLRVPFS